MPLESVSKWIREPRAWRAEAYLGSTLSTASKSNEVDAALARLAADVVSEKRARPLLEEVGARCPLDLWGSHPGALPRRSREHPLWPRIPPHGPRRRLIFPVIPVGPGPRPPAVLATGTHWCCTRVHALDRPL